MPRKQRVAVGNTPPRGTAQKIREWAAGGSSLKAIARSLGVAPETLNVWMERHPALREAMDAGRDEEHQRIHGAMMKAIADGNVTAMIFMLKARHGYREHAPVPTGNKVNITSTTFNLPAAASPEEWARARVIDHQKELPDAGAE